VQYHRR